jgi:Na+/proline symporter
MQMNTTLTHWDWIVIAVYLVLVAGIGPLFKHVNKDASDYFRGGGNMLWWIAGMSAIMASLSTWSFTGAAAKVYDTGILLPVTWIIAAVIYIPLLWYIAPRFRQMRVVTSIEAVFRRFGLGTEQFFTYMVIPMGIFFGGVGLNTVAVFMSAAMDIDMTATLIGLGVITTFMAMIGGQWAVTASDFTQGIMMFLVVGVVVYLSLNLPEIGGVTNLPNVLPERHLDLFSDARIGIVFLWIMTMIIQTTLTTLNMQTEGAKYLSVKDGRQARGMVALRFILTFIVPLAIIMHIPAMCAAVVFPDMSAVFPDLKVPAEGAFVAMAFKTLPQGLVGLLICGMFAAAITSLDTALNRNTGYFIRNVYIKFINKEADGERQLKMGRIVTVIFGVLMIIVAVAFDEFREADLFDVFLLFNSMLFLPSILPVALGVLFKRTPGWSGWSTVMVSMATGALAKIFYTA